jgi:hypothetical protein
MSFTRTNAREEICDLVRLLIQIQELTVQLKESEKRVKLSETKEKPLTATKSTNTMTSANVRPEDADPMLAEWMQTYMAKCDAIAQEVMAEQRENIAKMQEMKELIDDRNNTIKSLRTQLRALQRPVPPVVRIS